MRIGINLLHAMPEIGGGWNYIRDLVESLLLTKSDNHYIVFVTKLSKNIIPNDSINTTVVNISLNSRIRYKRLLFENTIFNFYVYYYKLDCIHWFCNYSSFINIVPSFVTVYDLQPFKEINNDSFIKKTFLKRMICKSIKSSRILLPMSNATKNDLINILAADIKKMKVIPPVLNSAFKRDHATPSALLSFRQKYNLPDIYWVYVAHYYPHKNHLFLLASYAKLIKDTNFRPWPLVLRGDNLTDSAEIMGAIDRLGLFDYVIFLPRLVEYELTLVYAAAGAMVFPSLYEGGGIPVLEAMACGCPVLSSTLPSIMEYAGDAASYFSTENSDELAFAMKSLQFDESRRIELIQRGLTQVQKYASDKIISQLLSAYESINIDSEKG